jgi:hypothetical protein
MFQHRFTVSIALIAGLTLGAMPAAAQSGGGGAPSVGDGGAGGGDAQEGLRLTELDLAAG